MAVKVFCLYSHKDKRLKDRLKEYLTPIIKPGLIEFWHDREIEVGSDWQSEIDKNIKVANIILLLISPDFLASDYCYGNEMKLALKKQRNDDAAIVPVILRPCNWENTPIYSLQVLPRDWNFINYNSDEDQVLNKIAQEIHQFVEQIRLPSVSQIKKPTEIEFVNRIDELREITRTNSATYLIVSAPAEFGKTRLLKKVMEYLEDKSFCIYLDFTGQENQTVTYLSECILRSCNVQPSKNNLDKMGLQLQRETEKAEKDEILICIDGADVFTTPTIMELLNEFIPKIEKSLSIEYNRYDLRIIFSVCQSSPWLHINSPIILKEIPLTPFNLDSVYESVKKFNLDKKSIMTDSYVRQYSKT
jgi:hypothetical protein